MPVQTTAVRRRAPALAADVARLRAALLRPRPCRVTQAPPRARGIDPGLWRMGVNTETGADVYVHPGRFERHPHVALWGAPGVGKTIKILQMFAQGLRIPRASWIILNIKGGLGRRARDVAIARGHAHRLEILDPGDPEHCAVYSPTHPNSLSWATHAKQLREGIRESTNMSSFDVAQQMARVLFMFLALTRLFDLTFVDTVALMRPKSALRKSLIRKVPDPELKAALQYFDSLPERRQDEIATSSMARLESFVFDPTLKAITCQKGPSIDIGNIIDQGKIFQIPPDLVVKSQTIDMADII